MHGSSHGDTLTSNGHVMDVSARRLGRLVRTPATERADVRALQTRLSHQGYLYLPGFLDPADVLAFRRFYFTAVGAGIDVGDLAAVRTALYRDVVPSVEYERFCSQPALVRLMEALHGGAVHLHKRKILRHVRPGEFSCATPAHYDLVYLREGTDRVLSIWIPLGNCPVERGGLMYLEGSDAVFRARDRRDSGRPRAAAVTADLPGLANELDARWLVADYAAGDIVVHSPYVIHASSDNVDADGVLRVSTDIRYQAAGDPIDRRWQHHWRHDDGL